MFTLQILTEFLQLCFYRSYNIPIIIYTFYSEVKLDLLITNQPEEPMITDFPHHHQKEKQTQRFFNLLNATSQVENHFSADFTMQGVSSQNFTSNSYL